jgi:hypothetical protein
MTCGTGIPQLMLALLNKMPALSTAAGRRFAEITNRPESAKRMYGCNTDKIQMLYG